MEILVTVEIGRGALTIEWGGLEPGELRGGDDARMK